MKRWLRRLAFTLLGFTVAVCLYVAVACAMVFWPANAKPSAKAPAEAPAVERAFTRSSERWLALEAYTRWLGRHSKEARSRDVLAEADAVFNLLVNWGGSDTLFWGRYAKKSNTVADLRRLGKTIRATFP